jgi:hypothetical protein
MKLSRNVKSSRYNVIIDDIVELAISGPFFPGGRNFPGQAAYNRVRNPEELSV